jgi:hypothetical protein
MSLIRDRCPTETLFRGPAGVASDRFSQLLVRQQRHDGLGK